MWEGGETLFLRIDRVDIFGWRDFGCVGLDDRRKESNVVEMKQTYDFNGNPQTLELLFIVRSRLRAVVGHENQPFAYSSLSEERKEAVRKPSHPDFEASLTSPLCLRKHVLQTIAPLYFSLY